MTFSKKSTSLLWGMSSVWCGVQGLLVKMGQHVSRPGNQRGFLVHPRRITSLLLFGSLPGNPNSPFSVWGVRPDLKIGTVVLPSLFFCQLPTSFLRRPPVLHPGLPSVDPSRVSILQVDSRGSGFSLQSCQSNVPGKKHKGHLHQSSSAKWAHWTTLLPCPPPSLHFAFTQTHPLPPMSYICLHWEKKANGTVVRLSNNSAYLSSQLLLVITHLP